MTNEKGAKNPSPSHLMQENSGLESKNKSPLASLAFIFFLS
jgi:hypothetical protein